MSTVSHMSSIPQRSGGRRVSLADADHIDQKRPRRLGNLAEVETHVSMDSWNEDPLSTLQDIGYNPDDFPRPTGAEADASSTNDTLRALQLQKVTALRLRPVLWREISMMS